MRVSTRVEYGVLALTDIALYSESGESVSAIDISERQGISKKYLEQILPLLKQAGLIRSQKGLHGGYSVCFDLEKLKMSEVLNALDNSVLEEMGTDDPGREPALRRAVNESLWGRINHQLISFAEALSFAEFLADCRRRMSDDWNMYVI